MNGLTSGTLCEILGGRLVLGTMPPLGGEWEPVARVVFDSREVNRGDIFWELQPPAKSMPVQGIAEEAFARGALGVIVTGRYVEPWAGACTIEVPDPQLGLERLAQWVLARSRRRRLLVVDQQTGVLADLLQRMIGRSLPAKLCCCAEEVAVRTIIGGWATGWDVIGVAADIEDHLARISDLCTPRVAVITSAAAGRMDLPPLLDALPLRGSALVAGDAGQIVHLNKSAHNIICIGAGSGNNLRVLCTRSDHGHLTVAVDDQCLTVPADARWSEHELSLAMLAGRHLGVGTERVAEACQQLLNEQQDATSASASKRTSEVPPLVSGLRESDATLPPGLKRWAC